MKNLITFFIILMVLLPYNTVAEESATIKAPAVVGEFEPFTFTLNILNDSIRNKALETNVLLIINAECDKSRDGRIVNSNRDLAYISTSIEPQDKTTRRFYNYNGEDSVNFKVVFFPFNKQPNKCKIIVKFSEYKDASNHIFGIPIEKEINVFPATLNIDLPDKRINLTLVEGTWGLNVGGVFYDKTFEEDKQYFGTFKYSLSPLLYTFRTSNGHVKKYNDSISLFEKNAIDTLTRERYISKENIGATEKFSIGGAVNGYYAEAKDIYKEQVVNNGKIEYPSSIVTYAYDFEGIYPDSHTLVGKIIKVGRVKSGDEEFYFEGAKKEIESFIGSIKLSKINEEPVEEFELTSQPVEGCEKEPTVNPSDVQVIFKLRPELTKTTIRNAITETSILRVYVTPELSDKNGKRIDICDIKEPGISGKKTLQAEFTNEKNYAGFTTGNILDERHKTWPCTVDITEEEHKCIFIISPNDVKKIVGQVKTVKENIALKIEGREENVEITLTPAGPNIKFNIGSQQLQQDSIKSIRFTIDDSDSKYALIKVKLLGPGTIFQTKGKVTGGAEKAIQESQWLTTRSILIDGKPGVEQEVGYKAPPLGNFDIGSAINSLSMVDLQTEAGKQILKDAALAYGEEYFQNLEDLADSGKLASDLSTYERAGAKVLGKYYHNNPGKYAGKFKDATSALVAAKKQADNVGVVSKAYKAGNGMYTLSELPGGIEGASKSMGTAAGVEEGSDEQTTSERIANVGIYAIDIAQMGVSILTYVPNKIPGVSKISAGTKTAFSAATNIWKANFKYWAQAEKIDRAKELFIPAMITVTAGDESGWETTYVLTLKVAYHQVN